MIYYSVVRFITIASRLVLVFFLAKNLDASDFRDFNILNIFVGLWPLLIGLDVTRYYQAASSTSACPEKIAFLSLLHHFCLYILTMPILLFALTYFEINLIVVWIIVLFEFLSQDLSRQLVATNHLYKSAVLNLIKSALPLLICSGCVVLFSSSGITVEFVFQSVAISSLLSILFGVKLLNLADREAIKINIGHDVRTEFLAAMKSGLRYLPNTFFTRGTASIDRLVVERLFTTDIFNGYVVLATIGSGILQLFDILFCSRLIPLALKLKNNLKFDVQLHEHLRLIIRESKNISFLLILVSIGLLLIFHRIFPEYTEIKVIDILLICLYFSVLGYYLIFNQLMICFEMISEIYISILLTIVITLILVFSLVVMNTNINLRLVLCLQCIAVLILVFKRYYDVRTNGLLKW